MTASQITLLAIGAFAAGCIVVWAPLSDRIRQLIINLAEARADSQAMTDKIAQLTADCVELQRLAHQAQEKAERWRRNAEGATGDWMDEQAAHCTTKRQLAAARGQITKLRKRLA